MNTTYGSTPYIKRGGQVDPKRLFYSDENIALKKMVTLVPGYGILEAGTLVGKITESTGRLNQYVPYAIQVPIAAQAFLGGAYILADEGATATSVSVTMEDSYKFAVGDHIAIVDNDATPVDLAAILTIDRTTYATKALITFAQVDISALDIADGAFIYIQTQTGTPFTNAVGVLVEGVDTGIGAEAVGGQAGVVFSNAMLYSGLLPNCDAGAITDLSAIDDGQFLIIK